MAEKKEFDKSNGKTRTIKFNLIQINVIYPNQNPNEEAFSPNSKRKKIGLNINETWVKVNIRCFNFAN